jgi:hypothetical protein
MDHHRHVELDGRAPEHVVVGMPVALACVGERRDPATLAAVGDRAPELGGRALRIEQRQMGDGTSRPRESRQKSAIQRL